MWKRVFTVEMPPGPPRGFCISKGQDQMQFIDKCNPACWVQMLSLACSAVTTRGKKWARGDADRNRKFLGKGSVAGRLGIGQKEEPVLSLLCTL